MTVSAKTDAALVIDDVTVTFPQAGGRRLRAVSGINLTLYQSDYVVIVGANGAGKSTLINVVAGAISPDKGEVLVEGESVHRMSLLQRSQVIGRAFQDPGAGVCSEFNLEENLILGMLKGARRSPFRLARTRARRRRAVELLAEYGRGLDAQTSQLAVTLSGGQRQLVALTLAMAQPPKLLLLDEHTAALDPEIARVVMERTDALIRENQLTTLMVTHNMRQAARYGDRLIIMSRGRIADEVSGEEKRALGEDGLVERFRTTLADEVTDRLLGS